MNKWIVIIGGVAGGVGFRGYLAARILQENGYSVTNLDGGYLTAANVLNLEKK